MKKTRVFLSYASQDRELAQTIGKAITKAGFDVWSDRALLPGDNWASATGEALENSDAMVVLVSPASADSDWVRREIEFAIGSPRYANRLIPVVVRPTPKMPWILDKMQQVRAGSDPRKTSRQVVEALERVSAEA